MSQSYERHFGHMGRGGWRRLPHCEQRWINRRCSFAPSKKNALSRVIEGRGRRGRASASGFELPRPVPGLNLRMRNRIVPTSSPSMVRYSTRVVTKCPTPSPVAFSSETASMIVVVSRWSPGWRYRAYSCSQLVATTEVKPPRSSRSMSSSCTLPPLRGRGLKPRITQACNMTGGATISLWTDADAASAST